jgi:hypothetical protein
LRRRGSSDPGTDADTFRRKYFISWLSGRERETHHSRGSKNTLSNGHGQIVLGNVPQAPMYVYPGPNMFMASKGTVDHFVCERQGEGGVRIALNMTPLTKETKVRDPTRRIGVPP